MAAPSKKRAVDGEMCSDDDDNTDDLNVNDEDQQYINQVCSDTMSDVSHRVLFTQLVSELLI